MGDDEIVAVHRRIDRWEKAVGQYRAPRVARGTLSLGQAMEFLKKMSARPAP